MTDTIKRIEPGTFNWVDLVAKDMKRARAFYEPFFGWAYAEAPTHGGPPYGMFTKDGKLAAGIGQMSEEMIAGGVPSTWNTYVRVDDIEATEGVVKNLGGSLMFETIEIPGAGKTNWVRDPEGAVFALWQAFEHGGAEIFNAPGSFSWNERATRDVDAAKNFYGPLFGWTFKDAPHPNGMTMSGIINAEGREIGHIIQMAESWGDAPPAWAVYFTVAKHLESIERAKSLGGALIMGPVEIEPGWFALLADPDGAMFYVFEDKR